MLQYISGESLSLQQLLNIVIMEEKNNIVKETGCGLPSLLIFALIIGFNVLMFWLVSKCAGWDFPK